MGPPVLRVSAATTARSALCYIYGVISFCIFVHKVIGLLLLYLIGFCFRLKFLERHAETLSIPVIFLNTVTATIRHVPGTRMSWMD